MIRVRRSNDRGHFDHGWLDTRHTFSFAGYHDPENMGFRSLRVINEDRVAPGAGFGAHNHRDMEIVTYVLEGALAHRDSTGSEGVLRPGEVQRMSAGSGVVHSEMNGDHAKPVHFLQIWILPEKGGIPPGYEQKRFEETERRGALRLVASPDARDGSVRIHQDATIYTGLLDGDERVTHTFGPGRYGWLQVARGEVEINDQKLVAGDGAAIENEGEIAMTGNGAEVLLFDLN